MKEKVDIVLEKAAANPHTFPTSETYLGPFKFVGDYEYWNIHIDYLAGDDGSNHFDTLYITPYWQHKADSTKTIKRATVTASSDGVVAPTDVRSGDAAWQITASAGGTDQFNIVLGAHPVWGGATEIVGALPLRKAGNYLVLGYYVAVTGTPVAPYLNMYLYKWS